MDYFLDDNNTINRLVEEWNFHGRLIIAYDFDNTVYDYNKIGLKFDNVVSLLRKCRDVGAYFIVFTACDENKYDFIEKYLNENDIPFDKINENLDFISFKGRKIYFNILLDDRAGLSSAYNCLSQAVNFKLENK